MTHVTCRLTAKNRNQLQSPTLGNQVRATFIYVCVNATIEIHGVYYLSRSNALRSAGARRVCERRYTCETDGR